MYESHWRQLEKNGRYGSSSVSNVSDSSCSSQPIEPLGLSAHVASVSDGASGGSFSSVRWRLPVDTGRAALLDALRPAGWRRLASSHAARGALTQRSGRLQRSAAAYARRGGIARGWATWAAVRDGFGVRLLDAANLFSRAALLTGAVPAILVGGFTKPELPIVIPAPALHRAVVEERARVPKA